MPRHARIMSEKRVYHIMMRGNNKESIFIDDQDKARIIEILADKKQEGEYKLFAFCIMDNHIHLVIQEGKDQLSRIIKRIGTSYAYYFNKKYKRIGHVFQDRYRSELIRLLLEKSNLSRRGIAVLLGLGRETVRKLSKEPSL